ncbi:MAG: hypothetical protein WBF77_05730 [Sulfurimonadaceae bacterium]
MNNSEILLLSLAIAILVGLILYSMYLTYSSSKIKSAASQAESLKNMLNEYAQKVQDDESTIDKKFESEDIAIPTKVYPKYDNSRAVDEMGLTQEDADSFVHDLVKAIESEIPRIEAAILSSDHKAVEEIVHTITGSSSTLGSGGVSSALISFYTAVQHRDSLQKLYIHLQNVKYYLAELREQYNVE